MAYVMTLRMTCTYPTNFLKDGTPDEKGIAFIKHLSKAFGMEMKQDQGAIPDSENPDGTIDCLFIVFIIKGGANIISLPTMVDIFCQQQRIGRPYIVVRVRDNQS